MSAETGILAILVKYLWWGITAVFGFLFAWVFKRINDTYTKQETDERIELSLKEVLMTVKWHGQQIEKLNILLEKIVDKDTQDGKDMASLSQKVDNIIERMDRESR
ncbi:MAG: hypothetical protein GOVbin4162_44 [Prokaryotic dsDNA virus sp.]|nr:MAG: hypothetical protein GOVbin4162_44 [Prokaryotic dsDNA virus sp.]|tara:strand:- start:2329 stop:2646 length:318 start_codon:yes stop_codon:yes gene_type:complete